MRIETRLAVPEGFMRCVVIAFIVLAGCARTDGAGEMISSVELRGQAIIAGGALYGLTDRSVVSIDLDGGPAQLLALAEGVGPRFPFNTIAVNDSEVFWRDSGPAVTESTIKGVPRRGGAARTVATLEGEVSPRLFADATNVYWSNVVSSPSGTASALQAVPVAGGGVVTLLSEPARTYTVAGIDSSRLYFFSLAAGQASASLNAIALDGSARVVELAAGPLDGCCIAFVGGTIIWRSGANLLETNVSTGITGTRTAEVIADGMVADSGGGFISNISCEDPHESGNAVCSASLRNLAGRVAASASFPATGNLGGSGMALDATSVYWTLPGHGLYRVKR